MAYGQMLEVLLGPLVQGRVYPDVTPDNPQFPLIVYEQPGGKAYTYVDNTLPAHKHARIQINVVSRFRHEANAIACEVERLMVESNTFLAVEVYGAFTSGYIEVLKARETRQDFGVWYKP